MKYHPVFRARIYSHFVKILAPESRIVDLLNRFYAFYTDRQEITAQASNKVFASYIRTLAEYRLHINQYYLFKEYLSKNHIPESLYTEEQVPLYQPVAFHAQVRPHWELRDYQEEAVEYLNDTDIQGLSPREAVLKQIKLIAFPTGSGKAQPLDALIKVPGGWSTMGEMAIGTPIIAPDGTTTQVTGVYPQGKKEVCRVIFGDGRTAECCREHLWKVHLVGLPRTDKVLSTRQIEQLLKLVDDSFGFIYVPLIHPEIGETCDLDLDSCVLDTEADTAALPDACLFASRDQRTTVLKKLINANQSNEFHVNSRKLAEQIQYLARSLGGVATVRNGCSNELYKPKKDLRTYWVVVEYPIHEQRLQITRIESIGFKETQCISVAHPEQLYITNDFVVTHNTVTSVAGLAKRGYRIAIVILPTYMPKWVQDIAGILDMTTKEVMTVAGSSQLKGLIHLGQTRQYHSNVVIISSKTFSNYIKAYEEAPEYTENDDYGCKPEELWALLGIGSLLIDETHQHIWAMFKLTLYMHVPLMIGLTATLTSDDCIIQSVHDIMYPKACRFNNITFEKYIKAFAISYSFNDFYRAKIRTQEYGQSHYSHNAFEKSIMRQHQLLKRYLLLITNTVKYGYIDYREPGDRLIVFASTVRMCGEIASQLKRLYPNLDIRTYTQQDRYDNLMEADICVSTVISAGTAVDIPQLTTVILTISIVSPVANLQCIGRLRKLKDKEVRFYYLYCEQINKQVYYHRRKKELFNSRVASLKELHYPIGV